MVHLRSYLPPKKYKRALLLKWTSVQSSISFLFWHKLNLSFTLFTLLSLQSIWFFFLFFPIFLFPFSISFHFGQHKSTTGIQVACLTSVLNRYYSVKVILNYSSECRIEKVWHINGEDVATTDHGTQRSSMLWTCQSSNSVQIIQLDQRQIDDGNTRPCIF